MIVARWQNPCRDQPKMIVLRQKLLRVPRVPAGIERACGFGRNAKNDPPRGVQTGAGSKVGGIFNLA
jgi:hypothetical protein